MFEGSVKQYHTLEIYLGRVLILEGESLEPWTCSICSSVNYSIQPNGDDTAATLAQTCRKCGIRKNPVDMYMMVQDEEKRGTISFTYYSDIILIRDILEIANCS